MRSALHLLKILSWRQFLSRITFGGVKPFAVASRRLTALTDIMLVKPAPGARDMWCAVRDVDLSQLRMLADAGLIELGERADHDAFAVQAITVTALGHRAARTHRLLITEREVAVHG